MANVTEDLDILTYRGDTTPIKLRLWDINRKPINVNNLNIRSTFRDEYKNIDNILQKTRLGGVSAGIITSEDANASDFNLQASNEMAIDREVDDTKNWRSAIYPFDVEFLKGIKVYTAIKGNLIVDKDTSRNV